MREPHKHAEIIKAWADGAEVEWNDNGYWKSVTCPGWSYQAQYRIKPEPKPDRIEIKDVYVSLMYNHWPSGIRERHLMEGHYVKLATMELTFDGNTNALKKAEVL